MPRLGPELIQLQRGQLDALFSEVSEARKIKPPRKGWIHTIRMAIGMSAQQLARKLAMTRQGVAEIERSEVAETITLATLRKAAVALNTDLVVLLLPRDSLETTVQRQARFKADEERNRVLHTMRLEAQEAGVNEVLNLDTSEQKWLTTRLRHLWD